MTPQYELLDADTAAAVMRDKDDILALTDGILSQTGGELAWLGSLTALCAHRHAAGMAEELMLAHESESPADELLHLYAEGLMLWHLLQLARITETPLFH